MLWLPSPHHHWALVHLSVEVVVTSVGLVSTCCSSIASMDLRPPSSSRISWKGLSGVRGRGEEGGGSTEKEERKEAEEGREAREVCRAREEEWLKGCWMGNVC